MEQDTAVYVLGIFRLDSTGGREALKEKMHKPHFMAKVLAAVQELSQR